MKKENLILRMTAAVTAGVLVMDAGGAFAGGNTFSDISSNIVDSVATIPDLVATVAYLGGLGLSVAGILKLKGHVDSPGQVALKDGLVRLGAGGGLLALPIVLEAMQTTMDADGTDALSPKKLNEVDFQ